MPSDPPSCHQLIETKPMQADYTELHEPNQSQRSKFFPSACIYLSTYLRETGWRPVRDLYSFNIQIRMYTEMHVHMSPAQTGRPSNTSTSLWLRADACN